MHLVREATDEVSTLLSYSPEEDVPAEVRAGVEERRKQRAHPQQWAVGKMSATLVEIMAQAWIRNRLVFRLLDDEGEAQLRAEVAALDAAGIKPDPMGRTLDRTAKTEDRRTEPDKTGLHV
jgi:hypothetical protein